MTGSDAGPYPGFKGLGGKYGFRRERDFVFVICLREIFLGATKFGGHCPRMPPRGYGPGLTVEKQYFARCPCIYTSSKIRLHVSNYVNLKCTFVSRAVKVTASFTGKYHLNKRWNQMFNFGRIVTVLLWQPWKDIRASYLHHREHRPLDVYSELLVICCLQYLLWLLWFFLYISKSALYKHFTATNFF